MSTYSTAADCAPDSASPPEPITVSDERRARFVGANEAQIARIIEAMDGLPPEVVSVVQRCVQFRVYHEGPPEAATVGRESGFSGITITLYGVKENEPFPQIVLWHEIAHVMLGHPDVPWAWKLGRGNPVVGRPRCELQAWGLLQEWLGKEAPSPPRRTR